MRFFFYLRDRPYQPQLDGWNCGLYVIYYMNCLGKGKRDEKTPLFDLKFNADEYRLEMMRMLLKVSEPLDRHCQFCFRLDTSDTVFCNECRRYTHTLCVKGNFVGGPICGFCDK